jgi:hypothetical protein
MKRLAVAAISIASVIGAHQTAATPINVTAERSVFVGAEGITVFGPASPSTALGAFDDHLTGAIVTDVDTHAIQTSNIQLLPGVRFIVGIGFAGVDLVSESKNVSAGSFFDVFFDIPTAHSYLLSLTLGGASVGGGRGLARFDLVGPTGLSFVALNSSTSEQEFGTLLPGSYHLTVLALMDRGDFDPGSTMGGSALWDFSLSIQDDGVTPTPEPGTLALLALGLAMVGGIRRRA